MIFLSVSLVCSTVSAEFVADINEIKAAYIYNFLKYTVWPQNLSEGPIEIGVINEGELFEKLSRITSTKLIANRPIRVSKITSLKGAKHFHVIFLGPDEIDSVKQLKSLPVLVVAFKAPKIEGTGIMINLYEDGANIKFEIDVNTISDSQLKVSSQLLKLAKVAK